jgi:uncharacterized membrane protein
MTWIFLGIIVFLIYRNDVLNDKLRKANATIKSMEGNYTGELSSIRSELNTVQLSAVNLERNMKILGEIGTLLDELTTLRRAGVTNQDGRIIAIIDKLKECRSRVC